MNEFTLEQDQSLAHIPFELKSLAEAKNYQEWIFATVSPWVGSRILELGAGIGNMSKWLPTRDRLILTENDPELLKLLRQQTAEIQALPSVSVRELDLTKDFQSLSGENLDTIISFNVLEHIEDDEKVLESLYELLKTSKALGPKRLITFVPAHQWAFGEMDKEFGHFRRYEASQLRALMKNIEPRATVYTEYFNVVGLLPWWWNGRVRKNRTLDRTQIQIFDRLVPWVRGIDRFLHRTLRLPFGQSVLFIVEFR
jgi:SAM-dependent methyltransferase